jgi:hypothetical protein
MSPKTEKILHRLSITGFALAFMVIGGYIRPYADTAVASVFAPSEQYVKAPTEFEVEVEKLFTSPAHQRACRGQAEYTVAYDLMHKYGNVASESIDKSEFPLPKSMPMTEAVEKSAERSTSKK